jgi:hypothetical protein
MDGDKIVKVQPHRRFKADNGMALTALPSQGSGLLGSPIASPMNMWPPARLSRS